MTNELYEQIKDEIPSNIGIYIYGQIKKRPKRQELLVDEDVLLMSMIRSQSRDVSKLYQLDNQNYITRLKSTNTRLQSDNIKFKNELHDLHRKLRVKFGYNWENEFE